MLGMADMALMGHFASKEHLGAIALGVTIFNMIYMVFGFLRMGTSGFTAQSYGASRNDQSILTLSRALFVALSGAFLILVLQFPIEKLSFWILDSSPEVESLTRSYFNIRVWAAPATISIYTFNGWFIGMQNARIPMTIAITINILNIILNVIFVYQGYGLRWCGFRVSYCAVPGTADGSRISGQKISSPVSFLEMEKYDAAFCFSAFP